MRLSRIQCSFSYLAISNCDKITLHLKISFYSSLRRNSASSFKAANFSLESLLSLFSTFFSPFLPGYTPFIHTPDPSVSWAPFKAAPYAESSFPNLVVATFFSPFLPGYTPLIHTPDPSASWAPFKAAPYAESSFPNLVAASFSSSFLYTPFTQASPDPDISCGPFKAAP